MHTRPAQQHPTVDPESLSRLEERLLREEMRVAEALLRRTRLLGEIAARRRDDKKKAGVGFPLEKALWNIWENLLQHEGVGQSKHWRQLVAQCNNLGYALGEQKTTPRQDAWVLRPTPTGRPVQFSGPTDIFTSKILTFWAAVTNVPMQLSPVVLNDGMIDLIKVLNQTGAGLSWEEETVTHTVRQNPELILEGKTIHAGQYEINFALMLALALGRPGIAKFSGSGILNMLQLKPWQNVLPGLGARLHQLNPHAPGLPARLECNGQVARLDIDAQAPADLVWALLAAAPFYTGGLYATWPGDAFNRPELEILSLLFEQCGVPFETMAGGIRISPATPQLPKQPRPFLDIGLNSLLLAWSRQNNQSITLQGAWPERISTAARHLEVLRGCGLTLETGPGYVRALPGAWPTDPVVDIRGLPQALPLAMVLALSAPRGCSVIGTAELDVIDKLARLTGRTCSRDGQTLRIHPEHVRADPAAEKLEAPDAIWGMAIAMTSFKHPGLLLANPGELTTLWPKFWPIFLNVLSVPKTRYEDKHPKASGTGADEPSKTSKRRRV